jgi:hypothetical protein
MLDTSIKYHHVPQRDVQLVFIWAKLFKLHGIDVTKDRVTPENLPELFFPTAELMLDTANETKAEVNADFVLCRDEHFVTWKGYGALQCNLGTLHVISDKMSLWSRIKVAALMFVKLKPKKSKSITVVNHVT